MYEALFFDIDGTLVDTEDVVIGTLQELLLTTFGETPDRKALSFVLGIPGDTALRHFTSDEALLKQLNADWSEAAARRVNEFTLFPGVKEMITELHAIGIPLGIITSKTRQEYADEFSIYGLDEWFSSIVTASDTAKHKPDAEPITFAADSLGIAPERLLYVGDTTYDLQATTEAGATFALAAWRGQDTSTFQGSKVVLSQPSDLIRFIRNQGAMG